MNENYLFLSNLQRPTVPIVGGTGNIVWSGRPSGTFVPSAYRPVHVPGTLRPGHFRMNTGNMAKNNFRARFRHYLPSYRHIHNSNAAVEQLTSHVNTEGEGENCQLKHQGNLSANLVEKNSEKFSDSIDRNDSIITDGVGDDDEDLSVLRLAALNSIKIKSEDKIQAVVENVTTPVVTSVSTELASTSHSPSSNRQPKDKFSRYEESSSESSDSSSQSDEDDSEMSYKESDSQTLTSEDSCGPDAEAEEREKVKMHDGSFVDNDVEDDRCDMDIKSDTRNENYVENFTRNDNLCNKSCGASVNLKLDMVAQESAESQSASSYDSSLPIPIIVGTRDFRPSRSSKSSGQSTVQKNFRSSSSMDRQENSSWLHHEPSKMAPRVHTSIDDRDKDKLVTSNCSSIHCNDPGRQNAIMSKGSHSRKRLSAKVRAKEKLNGYSDVDRRGKQSESLKHLTKLHYDTRNVIDGRSSCSLENMRKRNLSKSPVRKLEPLNKVLFKSDHGFTPPRPLDRRWEERSPIVKYDASVACVPSKDVSRKSRDCSESSIDSTPEKKKRKTKKMKKHKKHKKSKVKKKHRHSDYLSGDGISMKDEEPNRNVKVLHSLVRKSETDKSVKSAINLKDGGAQNSKGPKVRYSSIVETQNSSLGEGQISKSKSLIPPTIIQSHLQQSNKWNSRKPSQRQVELLDDDKDEYNEVMTRSSSPTRLPVHQRLGKKVKPLKLNKRRRKFRK